MSECSRSRRTSSCRWPARCSPNGAPTSSRSSIPRPATRTGVSSPPGCTTCIAGVDPFFQSANRGKRSVGVDLKHPDGRSLLSRLLEATDVFMTSLRADARRRLRLDVDDIRADNPSCVYVRGTAFGVRGPDAGRGGYDTGSYWARSGMQHLFTSPDAPWPAGTRPAFGDVVGGLTIAGAVSAALYQRATTGVAPVDRRVAPRVRDVADPARHRQRQTRRRGHPPARAEP